jgi:hypothetical protein
MAHGAVAQWRSGVNLVEFGVFTVSNSLRLEHLHTTNIPACPFRDLLEGMRAKVS